MRWCCLSNGKRKTRWWCRTYPLTRLFNTKCIGLYFCCPLCKLGQHLHHKVHLLLRAEVSWKRASPWKRSPATNSKSLHLSCCSWLHHFCLHLLDLFQQIYIFHLIVFIACVPLLLMCFTAKLTLVLLLIWVDMLILNLIKMLNWRICKTCWRCDILLLLKMWIPWWKWSHDCTTSWNGKEWKWWKEEWMEMNGKQVCNLENELFTRWSRQMCFWKFLQKVESLTGTHQLVKDKVEDL